VSQPTAVTDAYKIGPPIRATAFKADAFAISTTRERRLSTTPITDTASLQTAVTMYCQFDPDPNERGYDPDDPTHSNFGPTLAEDTYGVIGFWDTSRVEDMSDLFAEYDYGDKLGCRHDYADYEFNADISGWDMSNVIDMSSMFEEARFFNSDSRNGIPHPSSTCLVRLLIVSSSTVT
jgi:surface protein